MTTSDISLAAAPAGSDDYEAAFPLWLRFLRQVLPLLVGFIAVFAIAIGFTTVSIVEGLHKDAAQTRAATIARIARAAAPDLWYELLATKDPRALWARPEARRLAALLTASADRQTGELKLYSAEGIVLFSTEDEDIGESDDGVTLAETVAEDEPEMSSETGADGTTLYEFYVPYRDPNHDPMLVFELYEPTERLDSLLSQSGLALVGLGVVLLILLVVVLTRLVRRAQGALDHRSALVAALRGRLEALVSQTASRAVRAATGSEATSQRNQCAVLYTDIRGFTTYCEHNTPEVVMGMLNEIMGLQIDAVGEHGGDVDKLVGDALLARFDGPDRRRRALDAALAIQRRLVASGNLMPVGIGLFDGPVVSGTIGPAYRRDFTIIGDTVNAAARLCAAAAAGEVVATVDLLPDQEIAGFGTPEALQVKGRVEPLSVRRWRAEAA